MNKKILVSVTTLENPNWLQQIRDIEKFNIQEFAIFISCLTPDERKGFYKRLEDLGDVRIPFAHIRSDVSDQEIEYLKKRFGLKRCNLHPSSEYSFMYEWKNLRSMIYIENTIHARLTDEELHQFAGICLDVAHLENHLLTNDIRYQETIDFIGKYGVGASHISGILKEKDYVDHASDRLGYDNHNNKEISEFSYLKKYPKSYFGKYLAIEVMNDIKTQLEIKKYLEEILKDKLN